MDTEAGKIVHLEIRKIYQLRGIDLTTDRVDEPEYY